MSIFREGSYKNSRHRCFHDATAGFWFHFPYKKNRIMFRLLQTSKRKKEEKTKGRTICLSEVIPYGECQRHKRDCVVSIVPLCYLRDTLAGIWRNTTSSTCRCMHSAAPAPPLRRACLPLRIIVCAVASHPRAHHVAGAPLHVQVHHARPSPLP